MPMLIYGCSNKLTIRRNIRGTIDFFPKAIMSLLPCSIKISPIPRIAPKKGAYFIWEHHCDTSPSLAAWQSRDSVPFSWIAIAMPTIIQREGRSDGMPMGSSGSMPVRRLTLAIYASVLFSHGVLLAAKIQTYSEKYNYYSIFLLNTHILIHDRVVERGEFN